MNEEYSTDHTPLAAALYALSPGAWLGMSREGKSWSFWFKGYAMMKERELMFYAGRLPVPDARAYSDALRWARETMKAAERELTTKTYR
jgi:hypothetical protein